MVDLDKDRVYMVMELCRGGELFDRIAEIGQLEEKVAQRYLFQIASALDYCHKSNVFHRDLKPENVVLDEHDNIKVCDFGLAATMKQVQEDASYLRHTRCGSVMYAAPEVLTSNAQTGYAAAKADVWSLGVILYAMLAGALPFQVAHASKCSRFAAVVERGMASLCEANHFSAEATALICGMLERSASERYTMEQVLESEWLRPMRLPTSSGDGVAERGAPGVVRKWSTLLGDRDGERGEPAEDERGEPAERCSNGGGGVKKRRTSEGTSCTSCAGDDASGEAEKPPVEPRIDEDEEDLVGVNGMLVRSLGWVQLPSAKERMVEQVTSALQGLGADYRVERGELSDVVQSTLEPAGPPGGAAGGVDEAITQGQLTVRMRIAVASATTSDIHIEREEGNILQFHSFYRDVRNQLAGANGWSERFGRYHCEAHSLSERA
uniref:Protein kinase domain-containing protein n=1 Tax=Calcidiscus leptoporus TaxID=127549 RepID=A0A7S0IXS4_9EUKA